MSIGGALGRFFAAVFRNIGALVVIVLVPLAPLELLAVLTDPDVSDVIPNSTLNAGVTVAIGVVAFPWALGAIVLLLATRERGEAVGPLTALGRVDQLGTLIGTQWVFGIALVVGTLLLVVPGLFALGRWTMTLATVVLERRAFAEALGRSNRLARGRTPKVVAVVLVAFVAAVVPTAIVGGIVWVFLPPIPGEWLGTLLLDVALTVWLAGISYALYATIREAQAAQATMGGDDARIA